MRALQLTPRPCHFLFIATVVASGTACGSAPPAAPSGVISTVTGRTTGILHYELSGVVTDEQGAPAAGAHVEIDFVGATGGQFFTVDTDSTGRYSTAFDARPNAGWYSQIPNFVGIVYAYRNEDEFFNVQKIATLNTTVRQDFRLRHIRTVDAGQSVTVEVHEDSSACADLDTNFSFDTQCEGFKVTATASGMLTIGAVPLDSGGTPPTIDVPELAMNSTTGQFRFAVQSGKHYIIRVGIPVGQAPKRYQVSTVLTPS